MKKKFAKRKMLMVQKMELHVKNKPNKQKRQKNLFDRSESKVNEVTEC